MIAHVFWLLPVAAATALVLSALKLDAWDDIRRHALKSFASMVLGTLACAAVVELATWGL